MRVIVVGSPTKSHPAQHSERLSAQPGPPGADEPGGAGTARLYFAQPSQAQLESTCLPVHTFSSRHTHCAQCILYGGGAQLI